MPLAERPGRPRRGSPESEDLPRSPTRTPRGRRIRASQTLRSLGASPGGARAGCARRQRQDPGRRQDDDDLRPGPAERQRRQRAPGARRRQHGRRVLLRDDDVELRRLRQPDRQVPGVGEHRLGLQGERRLAAGRRRQGDAEGRRRRALVLRHLRPRRRPADARAAAAAGQLLRRPVGHRRRARRRARPTRRCSADGKRFKTKNGRACIGKHAGLVRATAPGAVRSNAQQ